MREELLPDIDGVNVKGVQTQAFHEQAGLGAGREEPIRVLIADDDPIVRFGLEELIERQPVMRLVGAAANTDEAVTLAGQAHPAVALVNLRMADGGGTRATREMLRVSPETKVVALSRSGNKEDVLEMLRAGATSFIIKGADTEEVLSAIESAARGEREVSHDVMSGLVDDLTDHLQRESRQDAAREKRLDRIRAAVTSSPLPVVYQPIADLRSGRMVGAEALVRFPTELGWSLQTWFDEAESLGLLLELELACFQSAISDLDRLPPDIYLAVNMSPDTALSRQFRNLLRPEILPRLVIEITEHAPVADYQLLGASLRDTRKRGLRLAVDDAASGYSSLRQILLLEPDIIKLDISITQGLEHDKRRRALAASLVSFAREMESSVVGEGIETPSQVQILTELGVHHGQGFHIARPQSLPLEDSGAWRAEPPAPASTAPPTAQIRLA
ncbi:MAG: hypothetical protein QOC87_792 [Actinomycetota bacterium]|nr:hypothetical protein [Actinomycetota bacterium]